MKRIPLNSLVILVGPAGAGKSTLVKKYFQDYEVVCGEKIMYSLIGEYERSEFNDLVFNEMGRMANIKLHLGERVVVDAPNLRKKDRIRLAELGTRLGAPVFYMVVNRPLDQKMDSSYSSWRKNSTRDILKHDQIYNGNEKDILRGDGIANVIEAKHDDFEVVEKLSGQNLLQDIKDRGYQGLMVIGDVHGMIEPLKNATEWASRRNLFAVFLGDIVDYGPNSIECVEHVYDSITRGRGICVIGNHERKIEKWIEQSREGNVRIRLSEGNKTTTRVIETMSPDARYRFESKFKTLLAYSRNHWIIGNTLFTHGAAEPEMFELFSSRLSGRFETMALFGEVDGNNPSTGYPNRIYNWVDRIPKGKTVMVGHDIRSTVKPLHVQGKSGGDAWFVDTGCGKGGRLTSADILFEGDDLSIKNFKYH